MCEDAALATQTRPLGVQDELILQTDGLNELISLLT